MPRREWVKFDTETINCWMADEDRSLALTLDDLDPSVKDFVQSGQGKVTEEQGEVAEGASRDRGSGSPTELSGDASKAIRLDDYLMKWLENLFQTGILLCQRY